MRNLKKFLALALAVVMTMSVMSIASAKTYSDSSTVADKYVEAVDVLSGLKVFEGDDTGAFNPKANITRAEVAAIIYRAATGDVDTDNYKIYADYNKFTDVPSTKWYAGYVNYCANAVYIRGVGNGKFNPSGNVTGYEALAMILRAVGYDQANEWTGAEWTQKVASTAKQLGITDTVNESTLGQPATREVVAELLFRTIAYVPTVTYSSTFGYNQYTAFNGTTKNPTLGEKNFSLVKIDGVITANEYADLDSSSALAAGKTEIDGTIYSVSTALTDIGESRVGWAYGKAKTVIRLVDSGNNTVAQTGAATNNITKFAKDNGISSVAGASDFLNFDYSTKNATKADIRIVYSKDGTNVTKSYAPDATITDEELAEIKAIFNDDNYENGWVIVGTTFKNATDAQKDDVSNTMKYSDFAAQYLYTNTSKTTAVSSTVNGDWLKVVDNDGDGVADYVFKTVAVMATVSGLTSKGVLTLTTGTGTSTTTWTGTANNTQSATASRVYGDTNTCIMPYSTDDELAVGDVVLYTEIDGTCYVQIADSFTGKVDKYTYKTVTLTVDGTDYEQSGIEEHTGLINALESAKKNTTYIYYQDWFGYIRAYTIPAAEYGDLVLLTDAYYQTGISSNTYAAKAYLNDEVGTYDVVDDSKSDNAVTDFIRQRINYNGWNKLINFTGDANASTNIARYSADGTTLDLAAVKTYNYNGKGVATSIATDYVDLNEVALTAGQRTYTGSYTLATADKALTNVDTGSSLRVQTNNQTVFYYVNKIVTNATTGAYTTNVTAVTGYANTLAVEKSNLVSVYAVATNTNADSSSDPYWVANVVVIETVNPVNSTSNSVVLGYNVLNKTVQDFGYLESVLSDANLTSLNVVSVDGVTNPGNYNVITQGDIVVPAFYLNAQATNSDDSYITTISSDFAKNGIYVGKADRVTGLNDYIVTYGNNKELAITDSTVVYDIYADGAGNSYSITPYDSDGAALTIKTGNYYIIVANAKNQIVYAVQVDKNASGAVSDTIMGTLYQDIYDDATVVTSDLSILVDGTHDVKARGETVTMNGTKGTLAMSYTAAQGNADELEFTVSTDVTGVVVDGVAQTIGQNQAVTVNNSGSALTSKTTYSVTLFDASNNQATYTITVTPATAASTDGTLTSITVLGVAAEKDTSVAGGLTYKVTIPYATNQSHTDKDLVVVPNESHTTIKTIGAGSSNMSTTLDTDSLSTSGTSATLVDGKSFTITTRAEDATYSVTYTVNVTVDPQVTYTVTTTASGITMSPASLTDTATLSGQTISLNTPTTGYKWQVNSITMGGTTIGDNLYSYVDSTGVITFKTAATVTGNIVVDAELVQITNNVTLKISQTNTSDDDVTITAAKINGSTVSVASDNVYAVPVGGSLELTLTVLSGSGYIALSSTGLNATTQTTNVDGTITVTYSNVASAVSSTLTGSTT